MHAFGGDVVRHVLRIPVILQDTFGINVTDAGVAALRLARGPAGDFEALKAHFRRGVDSFLKAPAVQNGGQQSKMKHKTVLLSCFLFSLNA